MSTDSDPRKRHQVMVLHKDVARSLVYDLETTKSGMVDKRYKVIELPHGAVVTREFFDMNEPSVEHPIEYLTGFNAAKCPMCGKAWGDGKYDPIWQEIIPAKPEPRYALYSVKAPRGEIHLGEIIEQRDEPWSVSEIGQKLGQREYVIHDRQQDTWNAGSGAYPTPFDAIKYARESAKEAATMG